VALDFIKATGPQSMIVEHDVREYLATQKTKPAARVTPLAKRMAEAAGVDLGSVAPVHPGTVIRRRMSKPPCRLLRSRKRPRFQPRPLRVLSLWHLSPRCAARKGRPVALTALRKTIARRMQESHLATARSPSRVKWMPPTWAALRADILKELTPSDPRPTYTDFLVVVLSRVLSHHPT